jgi:anti-sigma B factor antagonist
MLIREFVVADVTILRLQGRLGVLETDSDIEFCRKIMSLKADQRKVILDLGAVTYIDSGGLRVIVEALGVLQKIGGDLKILNPAPRALELLKLTGLRETIETFTDEAEAVRSFANPPTQPG